MWVEGQLSKNRDLGLSRRQHGFKSRCGVNQDIHPIHRVLYSHRKRNSLTAEDTTKIFSLLPLGSGGIRKKPGC